MSFLDKEYDRLNSLRRNWGLTRDDIYYAIENDLLRASVWLSHRYMERGIIKLQKIIFERHEHKEGFVGLRPKDFRRIYSAGSAELRVFRSAIHDGQILRLTDEPYQLPLMVHMRDIVVLREDRQNFESVYKIDKAPPAKANFTAAPDYRHIALSGVEYQFGDVQAAVIRQLHAVAATANPWVHGKKLLNGTNSKATRLRDVFKSKSDWNKLIVSDRRGYYRLNLPEDQ